MDNNIQEYIRLRQQPNWIKENQGYYIAIVDQTIVGKSKNRQQLLEEIRTDYPDKKRFFTLVEDQVLQCKVCKHNHCRLFFQLCFQCQQVALSNDIDPRLLTPQTIETIQQLILEQKFKW